MGEERNIANGPDKLSQVFSEEQVLSIYYTAGFPELNDTMRIAGSLEEAGANMLEIGIPFSDPIADGPTIQRSSYQALANGMTLSLLFNQLQDLRKHVQIPVLLMGYFNPILQFGVEQFCEACQKVGVDGVIVPDLPLEEFESHYAHIFRTCGIHNIFLIGPSSDENRIRQVDQVSTSFVYMVSSSSTTGAKPTVQGEQLAYFQRINEMNLKSPRLIGFGISNSESFNKACQYASGAIVGSAFIDQLEKDSSEDGVKEFVKSIKKR